MTRQVLELLFQLKKGNTLGFLTCRSMWYLLNSALKLFICVKTLTLPPALEFSNKRQSIKELWYIEANRHEKFEEHQYRSLLKIKLNNHKRITIKHLYRFVQVYKSVCPSVRSGNLYDSSELCPLIASIRSILKIIWLCVACSEPWR
jgi:hypothetical protein